MTFDELRDRILEILPNATFGEDADGQLVIYTGLRQVTADGDLIPF